MTTTSIQEIPMTDHERWMENTARNIAELSTPEAIERDRKHKQSPEYLAAVAFMDHSAQLKADAEQLTNDELRAQVAAPATEYHTREHAKAALQRRVWVSEQEFRASLVKMTDGEVAATIIALPASDPARLRRWALREQHYRAGRVTSR